MTRAASAATTATSGRTTPKKSVIQGFSKGRIAGARSSQPTERPYKPTQFYPSAMYRTQVQTFHHIIASTLASRPQTMAVCMIRRERKCSLRKVRMSVPRPAGDAAPSFERPIRYRGATAGNVIEATVRVSVAVRGQNLDPNGMEVFASPPEPCHSARQALP